MNQRYNFMLPQQLHRRFKAACIAAGLGMSPMLAHLIGNWLKYPYPPPEEQLTDEDDAAAKLQDVLDKASSRR